MAIQIEPRMSRSAATISATMPMMFWKNAARYFGPHERRGRGRRTIGSSDEDDAREPALGAERAHLTADLVALTDGLADLVEHLGEVAAVSALIAIACATQSKSSLCIRSRRDRERLGEVAAESRSH